MMKTLCRAAFLVAFAMSADAANVALDRMAASYHSYEFSDVAWTPPPDGYHPFYVSHYGRHGSRRINAHNGLHSEWVAKLLKDAKESGNLTPLGGELFADIAKLDAEIVGSQGELTQRGADEHRTLARRMAARTPRVFAPGRRVDCRATRAPRCLLSMANFALALSSAAPGIEISYSTSEKIHVMMTAIAFTDQKLLKRRKAAGERFYERRVDASRLLKSLFVDPSKVKGIDKPHEFARRLYVCASDCQCLSAEIGELDLWRYFTKDEITSILRCQSASDLAAIGHAKEFKDEVPRAASTVAQDIIERADRAIADPSIAADLRFGHDSGVWPVASFLDLEGPGTCCSMEEAWEICPSWKFMCMATNMQMVFFRNDAGDVLVKILWNERETMVRGLRPKHSLYYSWPDLKAYMQSRTAALQKNEP